MLISTLPGVDVKIILLKLCPLNIFLNIFISLYILSYITCKKTEKSCSYINSYFQNFIYVWITGVL